MSHAVFGPFQLDSNSFALIRDGEPVAIGKRAFALLEALLSAGGETVGKARLLEAGWPGTIVEEGNLSVQIAALRKALGTRPDGSEWIVTVPRLGYRLVRGHPDPGPDAASPVPSVAVLPFHNLSNDPDQDYFADGVVEDIIAALSRFRSFAVIARNTSFAYRDKGMDTRAIARELGVRYVLEGSVRRAGNRLRIAAQLIDAEPGTHLWGQNFDGSLEDVFDAQDRITESVVAIVEPHIRRAEIERSRRERPGSMAAYDLHLRALPKLFSVRLDENTEAIEIFRDAVALEPDSGQLLIRAGFALAMRHAMGWDPIGPDDVEQITQLTHRALALSPDDGEVLARASTILAHVTREYEMAVALADRAMEANPNAVVVTLFAGVAHLHCGSLETALASFQRSIALSPADPLGHVAMTGIAHAQMAQSQFVPALAWAERSLAVNRNWAPTYWMLIAANAHLHRMREAHRWLARFLEMQPRASVATLIAAQPDRYADRMANILSGLRLAGLPETLADD